MESPPPWVTVHYSSSSLPSIWEIVALPTISTLRSLWHRDLHLLQMQLCGTEPMSGACPWSLQIISIFLKMIALSLTFSPKICLWLVKKLLWLLRISVQILNTFQSKEKPKPNITDSDVFLSPLQLEQSHVRCDCAVCDYLGSKHINKVMVNLILLKKSVLTYFMESIRLCVEFIDSIVLWKRNLAESGLFNLSLTSCLQAEINANGWFRVRQRYPSILTQFKNTNMLISAFSEWSPISSKQPIIITGFIWEVTFTAMAIKVLCLRTYLFHRTEWIWNSYK